MMVSSNVALSSTDHLNMDVVPVVAVGLPSHLLLDIKTFLFGKDIGANLASMSAVAPCTLGNGLKLGVEFFVLLKLRRHSSCFPEAGPRLPQVIKPGDSLAYLLVLRVLFSLGVSSGRLLSWYGTLKSDLDLFTASSLEK